MSINVHNGTYECWYCEHGQHDNCEKSFKMYGIFINCVCCNEEGVSE